MKQMIMVGCSGAAGLASFTDYHRLGEVLVTTVLLLAFGAVVLREALLSASESRG